MRCLDSCHTRHASAKQHRPRREADRIGQQDDEFPRNKPAHVAERQSAAIPRAACRCSQGDPSSILETTSTTTICSSVSDDAWSPEMEPTSFSMSPCRSFRLDGHSDKVLLDSVLMVEVSGISILQLLLSIMILKFSPR